MPNKIWCVCKDPGGTAGILAIAKELAKKHLVAVISNGWASKNSPVDHYPFESIEKALTALGQPKALVTSLCSGGGAGRDLVPLLYKTCPTIAVQDAWNASLEQEWANLRYQPHFVIVNDPIGKNLVTTAWKDFPTNRIMTFGFPVLDELAHANKEKVKFEVRQALGLVNESTPIVLFTGTLDGTAETMGYLGRALNTIGKKVYFIPRLHPRTKTDAPNEYRLLNQALNIFHSGQPIVYSDNCTTTQLIQAATVVIAETSTTLVHAAALGQANISMLYPASMKRFLQLMNNKLREFPLVSLGCTAKTTNQDELVSELSSALDGSLHKRLQSNQAQHFQLDGKNTTRIADFVSSLL